MAKYSHEIRDPIHVFVCLSIDERNVVDSEQAIQGFGRILQQYATIYA